MRVAKWPFNTFQANMLKARALATTQQYLNRFMNEGPDKFVETYVGEWMAIANEFLGFDLMAEMRGSMVRYVEEQFAKRLPQVPPKIDEAKAKELNVGWKEWTANRHPTHAEAASGAHCSCSKLVPSPSRGSKC